MNVDEVAALPLADKAAILIREHEGYVENAMWDVNAYRIGLADPDCVLLPVERVGHGSDTITFSDGTYRRVKKGDRTTRANALKDLTRRVSKEFLPRLKEQLGEETFNNMPWPALVALTSLSYNYGRITKPSIIKAAQTLNMPLLADTLVTATYNDNKSLPEKTRAALRKRRAEEAEYIRMAKPSQGGVNAPGGASIGPAAASGAALLAATAAAIGIALAYRSND